MNCTKCMKFGKILLSRYNSYFGASLKQFSLTANKCTLYFSKKHEWVDVVDELGTVGISHYAQESLGDIVYAQLPEIGSSVTADEECGALESVKAASELYSPVSGLVVDINDKLEAKPELINQSCYTEGWLFRVEMVELEQVNDLMTEEQYMEFLKTDYKKES